MWDYPYYELYAKVSNIKEIGLELVTSLYQYGCP
jgi:hypothetical protein